MTTRAFAALTAVGVVGCLGLGACTADPARRSGPGGVSSSASGKANAFVMLLSDPDSTIEARRSAAAYLDVADQQEVSGLIRSESSHAGLSPIGTLRIRQGRLIPKHKVVLYPTKGQAGWVRAERIQLRISRASLTRESLTNDSPAREPEDEFEPRNKEDFPEFLSRCRRLTAEHGVEVEIPALPAAEGEVVTVTGFYAAPRFSADLSNHEWANKSVVLARVVVFPEVSTPGSIENQAMQGSVLTLSMKAEEAINWEGAQEPLAVVKFSGEARLVGCTPSIRAKSDQEFTVTFEVLDRGRIVEGFWLAWVTKLGTRCFLAADSKYNEEQ